MSAGTPVYNSYGHHLTVDQLFASYGYVPTMAVLVTAPSLTNAMEQHAQTTDTLDDPLFRQLCIGAEMQFFGPHVPDSVVVSARYHAQEQTTTLRPGRPTQLTYQCLRVVLNNSDGTAMAQWLVPYLRFDIQQLDDALAVDCADNDNTPHVRVNRMAREALQFALDVAVAQKDDNDYPGIAYP